MFFWTIQNVTSKLPKAACISREKRQKKFRNPTSVKGSLRDDVTVGLHSSSFWQGEPISESAAQVGLDPRAKELRPYNAANRRVQNTCLFD
jgi:hypothetical protein